MKVQTADKNYICQKREKNHSESDPTIASICAVILSCGVDFNIFSELEQFLNLVIVVIVIIIILGVTWSLNFSYIDSPVDGDKRQVFMSETLTIHSTIRQNALVKMFENV